MATDDILIEELEDDLSALISEYGSRGLGDCDIENVLFNYSRASNYVFVPVDFEGEPLPAGEREKHGYVTILSATLYKNPLLNWYAEGSYPNGAPISRKAYAWQIHRGSEKMPAIKTLRNPHYSDASMVAA